jgi:hypothetical protein
VEKVLLGNPEFPFNQYLMHGRDLPSRSAETDEAGLQPEANDFTEGRRIRQVKYRLCSL